MTDCTDLEIDLGDLSAPAFALTTTSLELARFDPGEAVELSGTLFYSLF